MSGEGQGGGGGGAGAGAGAGERRVAMRGVPCDACAAEGAFKGAAVGLCWGGFMGTCFGWHDNIRGRLLAVHVFNNLGLNALGFASFCGIYQLLHCNLEKKRGTSDVLNATLAGFATGGVMGSLAALRNGQPKMAVLSACGTSLITSGVDYVRGYR